MTIEGPNTSAPETLPVLLAGESRDIDCVRIRQADPSDAVRIHALIMANLATGHLLPRSLSDIEAASARFRVACRGDELLASAELAHLSPSVAEIRSLVVQEGARGLGLGRRVVDELRARARAERYRTLCAFTHDPRFFVRMGFSIVPHFWLPEKISVDCWSCSKFRKCGQYGVVDRTLGPGALASSGERHVS